MGAIIGTIIRLFLICVAAGLFMAFFGITPSHLVSDAAETLRRAYNLIVFFGSWAMPYALLGASVVVPIAIVILVLRLARR